MATPSANFVSSGATTASVTGQSWVLVSDLETEILFKVVENANLSPNKDGIIGLLNLPGTRDYQVLRPSGGRWTREQADQIHDGIQTMNELIQRALAK